MKKLGIEWETYKHAVMPQGAGPVQVTETRRAFYAGASAMLSQILKGMDMSTPETTDGDMHHMDELRDELKSFLEDLKKGVA